MAQKARLRENRYGTVINGVSKRQELELGDALIMASEYISGKFDLKLIHAKKILLSEIVENLRQRFPDVEFEDPRDDTYMSPDGGILSILDHRGKAYPILISEVKNQGTNDLRIKEGKGIQSKGNAIERLGKNVIGFRTSLLHEGIMPFVCFGYGWDFQDGSSIIDRVRTIAMFGELNSVSVSNSGPNGIFNRGSFYFRQDPWTLDEMSSVMMEICERSVHYYYSRYGEGHFAHL